LIAARIQAIQEMERLAARLHQKLTHSEEVLRIHYQPSYDPLPRPEGQYALPIQTAVQRNGFTIEQIRQGFLAQLQARRTEELARGVTAIGPHRDEMEISIAGKPARAYGSQGQQKSVALVLKLAEVELMRARVGEYPVVLLDEALAELDARRGARLFAALPEEAQTLVTTAQPAVARAGQAQAFSHRGRPH